MNEIGKKLGNYQLTRLIGRGGFADVYLAEHIYLKTRSAIKVLHTRVGQEDMQSSFLKEAQIIARLSHPHIVRVLDFGIEQETPYLAMEYAPNGTLRQRLSRQEKLPLSMIVYYTRQIASALQYAHEQHLIHRDVKPENLFLGQNYEALLGDFGISTIIHTSQSLPTQGITGTIMYMAPEQILGKPRPASDQYALAVVVYEWLTGHSPFSGSFAEIAAQHIHQPPPEPRTFVKEIPVEVELVLLTALAKDPEKRFQRIDAFARALEQASLQVLTPDEATLLAGNLDAGETRNKFETLAATVLSTLPADNLTPAPQKATPQLLLEVPGGATPLRTNTGQSFPRRKLFAGLAALAVVLGGGAVTAWETGLIPGWAKNVAATPGVHPLPTSTSASTPTSTTIAQPTPGSTTIAQPPTNPAVPPQTVGQVIVHQQGTAAYAVAWDPVLNRVASCGNDSQIQIWNPANGQTSIQLATNQAPVYDIAWSPDGRFLAAAYDDGTAGIWDMVQNRFSTLLTGVHTRHVNSVAWSPDGFRLATASSDHTVAIWDVLSGTVLMIYTGHSSYVNTALWSRDSTKIASASGDATVQIWSPDTGQQLLTYTGHNQEVLCLSWSPDGDRIVSGSIDTTARVWSSGTGATSLVYTGHRSFVVAVAWSPDGLKVASGGGDQGNLPTDTSVQIWDPNSGQRISTSTSHSNEIEGITWSPDIRSVASASDDYTVQVWQPT